MLLLLQGRRRSPRFQLGKGSEGAPRAQVLAPAHRRRLRPQHHPRLRVAEGHPVMALRDGLLYPLGLLLLYHGCRHPAPLLLPPGDGRSRRRPHRLLDWRRSVRVLGHPPHPLRWKGLRPRPSAGDQVPRSQWSGLSHDGRRLPLDLGLVLCSDRSAQLLLSTADHPPFGAEPCLDSGGDAQCSQFDSESGYCPVLPQGDAVQYSVQLPASHHH